MIPPAALCFPRLSSSNTPRADVPTLFYCSSQTLALDRRLVMDFGLFKLSAVRGEALRAPPFALAVRPRLSIALRHVPPAPPYPPARRRPVLPTYHPFLFLVQYFRFYGTRKKRNEIGREFRHSSVVNVAAGFNQPNLS